MASGFVRNVARTLTGFPVSGSRSFVEMDTRNAPPGNSSMDPSPQPRRARRAMSLPLSLPLGGRRGSLRSHAPHFAPRGAEHPVAPPPHVEDLEPLVALLALAKVLRVGDGVGELRPQR